MFHNDKQLLNFLKNLIKIKDILLIGTSITLLNFDLKIISKSLANRVKRVSVNERFIGESGCLIVDVIKVCDLQNIRVIS